MKKKEEQNVKAKLHVNSLLFKIVSTVIVGIICLSVALSYMNVFISKRIFVNNFSNMQRQIFRQVDEDFFQLYNNITSVISAVKYNESVQSYLAGNSTQEQEMRNILDMKSALDNTRLSENGSLNLLLVGRDGTTYNHNRDRVAVEPHEILSNRITESVNAHPDTVVCEYIERGFTDTTKREPVVVFASAINDYNTGNVLGYAYISVREADIRAMYNYFASNTSEIVIFNQDGNVISTSNEDYLTDIEEKDKIQNTFTRLQEENAREVDMIQGTNVENYLLQQLQSTNYKMLGIINPQEAFAKQYNYLNVVLMTVFIAIVVVLLIGIFIRQQTQPLRKLVGKMGRIGEGRFDEYVEVEGTEEVKQLSGTYNAMLDELNQYVDQLIEAEEEKRKAEIHALQMQINPHYIYNTLASIKWLIWQGDAKKSTQMIDAFISLLRNTISNKDEFITVEQEIENLKNYVFINQTRYGDKVHVEFFMTSGCSQYPMPKLILQPFVENAFFHAFPEGMEGTINIYVKEEGDYLRFTIADNGVGMKTEQLRSLQNKERVKSEHFTGIGVNNVDDRIKLVYGMDYGVLVGSEENQGTSITIILPKYPKNRKETD